MHDLTNIDVNNIDNCARASQICYDFSNFRFSMRVIHNYIVISQHV